MEESISTCRMSASLFRIKQYTSLTCKWVNDLSISLGESTVANHGSRENTVDLNEDTGGDRDDNDSDLDLPTLEDLFSEAKAKRHIAVVEPGQEPY